DGLKRRDPARLERAQPLVAPADRGPERDAVVAELALVPERLELGEQVVALDRVHAWVVELIQVYVVGAEAAQACLERRACVLGGPIGGALALRVLPAIRVEHVAELRRDLDRAALGAPERAPDDLLVRSLPVRVARVEEGDPELEGAADQPVRIVRLAPPVRTERPGTEGDLGGVQIGVGEAALTHREDPT